MRVLSALLMAVGFATPAVAGPITFTVSAAGFSDGGTDFPARPTLTLAAGPGESASVAVTATPILSTAVPTDQTGSVAVTVTDAASGESGTVDVPVLFYTDPTGAWLGTPGASAPGVGQFATQSLPLGDNLYHFSRGTNGNDVTVEFERFQTLSGAVDTPEPAAVLLAVGGLASVWGRRRVVQVAR